MQFIRVASVLLALLARYFVGSVLAVSPDERWPHNLPAHVKYWPEDESRIQDLARWRAQDSTFRAPVGIRKMSEDEGEKFFMEYWEVYSSTEPQQFSFHVSSQQTGQSDVKQEERSLRPVLMDEEESMEHINGSIPTPFHPPFLLHTEEQQPAFNPHAKRDFSLYSLLRPRSPEAALEALQKREFTCPYGTSDCSSVGRPTSCCAQGETCQIIQDTGLGDVGCCPSSGVCSGAVRSCDPGFLGCGSNIGGGCCIPNYVCVSDGCGPGPSLISVLVVTPTVTTTLSPPSTSSSSTTSTSSTSTTSTSVSPSTTSILSSTSTSTSTSSTASPDITAAADGPQTTLACSTGFKACPVSLGGGCCRTDRECGPLSCPAPSTSSTSSTSSVISSAPSSTSSTTSSSTSTALLGAPFRPTSNPPNIQTSTSTLNSPNTNGDCPTGFYECEAFYRGGCCRIGRDCESTSCPAGASTTLRTINGVTVIVPNSGVNNNPSTTASGSSPTITSTITATSGTNANGTPSTTNAGAGAGAGRCATGWYSCPAQQSGGCCPSGYACGIGNCVATATTVAGATVVPGEDVAKIPPTSGSAPTTTRLNRSVVLLVSALVGLVSYLCT